MSAKKSLGAYSRRRHGKTSEAAKQTKRQRRKVARVMGEFSAGELPSGSKQGPKVTNRKQAAAIAMSEAGVAKKKTGR